jgi:hypothetical protein
MLRTELSCSTLHHADTRHCIEWAVQFFGLGDIDIKHGPMAVHHLVAPIIAHVVDGGYHKAAVPQKLRPRRGA